MKKKLYVGTNMAWFLVIIAGIIECFWASGLKYAQSMWAYNIVALGIILSFVLNLVACRVLEASTVYAVFVGIGTAGIVSSEILIFDEPFSFTKVILIFLLLCAVIGLKLSSKSIRAQDSRISQSLGSEIGLDDVAKEK
ncbi:multidrug efflux SMR transporter [uncultured Helicobacter sp.]|uniref:DMT family transporter n=1 Tax=Helicobacter TaxID=209 RepID=UPI00345BB95D